MAGAPKAKMPAQPLVSVAIEGGPFADVKAAAVRRRAEKMLARLELADVELSLALVDDASIRALNHAYRKKDKATDVLAFPMLDPLDGKPPKAFASKAWALRAEMFGDVKGVLGDVIISIETARKQARENQRPLMAEVTMLLAHGLLHLLGFDHRTDAEERAMTAATCELERAANAPTQKNAPGRSKK